MGLTLNNITLEECQTLITADYDWQIDKFFYPGGEAREDSLYHRTFKSAPIIVLGHLQPLIMKELITKYEVGDHCWRHRDPKWLDVKQGWQAYAVWITPLNDDYEGGELLFNDIVVKQEVGVPIKRGHREPHEITQVTSGTRYSLVSWVFKQIIAL